jgi:hypothetical protein
MMDELFPPHGCQPDRPACRLIIILSASKEQSGWDSYAPLLKLKTKYFLENLNKIL